MSNVITHHHDGKSKKDKTKSKNAIIVIVSLILLAGLLIGLDKLISKKNNNIGVIEKISDSSYIMGEENSKIKLVVYSDFECPACAAFSSVAPEVLKKINEKYGKDTISLTYKYFPLISIHRNALLSAYSAEAARIQGKFWDMEKVLFEKQSEWENTLDAKSKIESYARDMGLDMALFIKDRDSESTKDIVNKSLLEATKLGLSHTPFVFMNGVEMKDLRLSVDDIVKTIEAKISEMGIQPIAQ